MCWDSYRQHNSCFLNLYAVEISFTDKCSDQEKSVPFLDHPEYLLIKYEHFNNIILDKIQPPIVLNLHIYTTEYRIMTGYMCVDH